METTSTHYPTIIIGAGQCGLAMAHELSVRHEDFMVLDSGPRPGHGWLAHWDSLRLFTPAVHDALPGRRFPGDRHSMPTAVDMAGYLVDYAEGFDLPVRSNTTVLALASGSGGFSLATTEGSFTASRVVVATGAHAVPRIPEQGALLDGSAVQLHSSGYKNPAMIGPGSVAVIGFGTSGAQIARELAPTHPVTLYGTPTRVIPEVALRYAPALYWAFIHHVLTRSTPIGRKAVDSVIGHGAPLIRSSPERLRAAGVERGGRIVAAKDGALVTDDGIRVEAETVIWATGYRPDYSWISGLEVDGHGLPVHTRGISGQVPGLGFLGLPFQYGLTSALIGGAGRDAGHLARNLQQAAPVA